MANTVSRAVVRLIPMLAAAVGLPRMAARYRPTVPRCTSRTSTMHNTRATKHSTRKARSEPKSMGPSTGRATVTPFRPPPDHEYWNRSWSANKANDRVTSASSNPEMRTATMATTLPTAAAMSPPTTAPRSTGSPKWAPNWPAAKAPTPAKVAWHNEIWPLMPVMRVMDRKMIDSVRPSVNAVTHTPGTHVTLEAKNATTRAQKPHCVGLSRRLSRTDMAGGGRGGGHRDSASG